MVTVGKIICNICKGNGCVPTYTGQDIMFNSCRACHGSGKMDYINTCFLPLKMKKLHPDAVIPQYAKPGDAGLDLIAIDNGVSHTIREGDKYTRFREYRTGLAMEIPPGHVGLIFPRSSISNVAFSLTNAVGVIDSGYRGEVRFRFRELNPMPIRYKKGDKVGQLVIMPYPQIQTIEVEELSSTERGIDGFGSSGR